MGSKADMHPTPKTLSAGVIITRDEAGKTVYLLLRAYGYWDFPKGIVEPGEDPLDTVIREVAEETILTDLDFRWGHEYRETPPYGRGKVARYYLAENREGSVSLPVSPERGRPEHDEYRWLGYRQARKLLAARVQPVLDWAHELISSTSSRKQC